jgi:ATP-binding cassette subfamily B protein
MNQTSSLFSFIKECIEHFKWLVAGQIFVGLVWAIDLSLRPYLLKLLINEVSHFKAGNSIEYLLSIAGFYLFMAFFIMVVFRFYDVVWMHLNSGLKNYIALEMIDRMMMQSHSFYQNNFSGKLANKIKDTMGGIPDLLQILFDKFWSHGMALLVAIYAVWQADINFAMSLSAWATIYLTGSIYLSMKSKKYCDKASEMRSSVVGYMVDLLSNMLSVRLFNARDGEMKNFGLSMKKFTEAYLARDWFFLYLFSFQGFSFVIYQGVTLFWLITGVQEGHLTPGDFAMVLTINISIVDILWSISKDVTKFAEVAGDIRQGLDLINTEIEVKDKEGAKDLVIKKFDQGEHFYHPIFGGKITFSNVEFNYADASVLFKNKTVIVDPGQKVGLVGYSGSGKSTFVNLVLRLFDVTSGQILIDDQDISEVTQKSLRDAIAIIPQDTYLFHRPLMENIRYGNLNASDKEVIEAAKKAHAHEFIMELPEKYDSLVGERGVKLSGGQRQRIAIARAILKNAPILILDEATSHLDSLTENRIQDSLAELMEGRTTIVIAHRLSTLLHMDRILVFNKGKIVEDGDHKSLLERNELYATLWETQVNGFLPNKPE